MKRTQKVNNFLKCVDPCPRFLSPGDTHEMSVFCLGEEHARDALEGASCANCECFSMRTLRSRLALFSREESSASGPRGTGPARAEAERRLASWGSQMELIDSLERCVNLSDASSAGESELQVDDGDVFPTGTAASAFQDGQEMADEDE